MPEVYQQIRRVESGGLAAEADGTEDDFDMEISLTRPRDERLKFEARVWNLAPDTWRTIRDGEVVRIVMGWGETTTETMCVGTAKRKYTEQDEADTVFVLEGTSQGTTALERTRASATLMDMSVGDIARRIAYHASLSTGRVDEGPTLSGAWAMKAGMGAADYWLDELVEDAERESGEQWEWFVEDGKLNFVSRSTSFTTAFVLDSDNAIVSESTGETTKSEGGDELSFDALLDPRVRKGAYCRVDTDNHSGVYRVAEYEVTSNTTDGVHEMTGSLAPSDAVYRPANWYDQWQGAAGGGI